MCCRCCSVKQQKVWVFSLGSLLTVIGILLVTLWPSLSDKIVHSKMVLEPGTFSFKNWEVTPVPVYLTFYLYNWTNPHEVNNPNVKPNFVEHGPYTFREYKTKEDLVWHNKNNTVTFFARRTWHFDAERSKGSLNDVITIPNFATVAAAKIARNTRKFIRKIANFGLIREGGALTMTHTANDWIFDGFPDDAIDFCYRLHSKYFPIFYSDFAWFYQRNNSKEIEGSYTIHTGKGDIGRMGDLLLWNDTDHTNFWRGECSKVNGSTGDLWSPNKKWDEVISIFIGDAARFVNLFPQKKVKYEGLEAWYYTSTDQTYDNGHIAKDTKCFCLKEDKCPAIGVTDFSKVTFNAPVYISHPHFLLADPMFLANTTGLKPDPEKHINHVLMEPKLGIPLDLSGQSMVSLLVERDEYIDYLRDIAHTFYAPLFTLQLKGEINDDIMNTVKFALSVPKIGVGIGIGCLSVGVIMIIVGLLLTKMHKWRGDVPTTSKAELQETQEPQGTEEKTANNKETKET